MFAVKNLDAKIRLRQCGQTRLEQAGAHGRRQRLKTPVGRVYQQTFIDTYAKVAFAKLYDRKMRKPVSRGVRTPLIGSIAKETSTARMPALLGRAEHSRLAARRRREGVCRT